MADLSLEAAHDFWLSYEDKEIYKIILFLESSETWAMDGVEVVEKSLGDFAQIIDRITDLGNLDYLIRVLAHLRLSRMLFILQLLDAQSPGNAAKVLMHAEDMKETDPYAFLLLKRNTIFERFRLMSKLFSKSRLTAIQTAFEGENA
jgi:hypothetical protein